MSKIKYLRESKLDDVFIFDSVTMAENKQTSPNFFYQISFKSH